MVAVGSSVSLVELMISTRDGSKERVGMRYDVGRSLCEQEMYESSSENQQENQQT